ncbi:S-layer homology domain-containing protein [Demequina aurantiaca]|uniref:S-layer homology domain-containing protein n=1 Tax=Demequina aurantiaca TaxID=676200 RepID=UPI003D332595
MTGPKLERRVRAGVAAVFVLVLSMATAVGGATIASSAVPEPSFVVDPPPAFGDVAWDAKFYSEIMWLADQQITTGYSDGKFHPTESVSREAFAAFLYRLEGKPSVTLPSRAPFSDVKNSDQFYTEIVWLSKRGITTGWPDGTFRPKEKITREAIAAFLYRFEGKPSHSAPNRSPFKDMTTRSKFFKEVTWLAKSGITTGYANGTFRPKIEVSREAIAAFLYRGNTLMNTDGTYKVGSKVQAGTYVAYQHGLRVCVWQRMAPDGEVIGWNFTNSGRNVVEIKSTDGSFWTKGCGAWAPLQKLSPKATTFGGGISVVGFHMKAGLYASTVEPGCEWTSFSGLGGFPMDVLDEGALDDKPASVRLGPGEAIRVAGCDIWRRVGS